MASSFTSRSLWVAIALAGIAAGTIEASAQDRSTDPRACAPADRLRADPQGASDPKSPQQTTGENLSDKLARTDGVICPPDVGPDMRMSAPDTGTTPVIPPPGTPGGDPSVRPK